MSNTTNTEDYKVFSTFTGAGGLDIGFHGDFDFIGDHFEKLKFKTVTSMDLNKDACDTVEADQKYFKDTKVVCGDIIKADPKDYNDQKYDVLLGGFPCFVAGTKVHTSKGYRDIEKVGRGDWVMTHNKRLRPVTQIMKKETRKIYTVSVQGAVDIECTKNHPFYVKRKGTELYSWIDAENLEKGDMAAYPINMESEINISKDFGWVSDVADSKDFWKFIGIYIQSGYITNYDMRHEPPRYSKTIIIKCRNTQLNFVTKLLRGASIEVRMKEGKIHTHLYFNDDSLFSFLRSYGSKPTTRGIDDTFHNLPKEIIKSFISGIFDARVGGRMQRLLSATVWNEGLAHAIQQLVHKSFECICKIKKQKNGSSKISFTLNAKNQRAYVKDGYIWSPITKISMSKLKEDVAVYNLEVQEDHSYTANNILVHNCVTFSLVGNRMGITDDVKGKLYESYVRFVEELRPKVFLAENVKGILSANKGEAIKVISKRFEETGYKLKVKLINFADFGVPQLRERVLFVGVREDIDEEFLWPEPTHIGSHITSEQAIDDIQEGDELSNNNEIKHPKKTIKMLEAIPEGGNFKDLPPELSVKAMMSNIYRKLDRKKPAYTVIASGGGGTWHYHYEKPRALTNRERARIQSFPDDLHFKGTNAEARRQIGNAVPPVGVYLFAKEIQRILDKSLNKN